VPSGYFADVIGDGEAGLAELGARMVEVRDSWWESSGGVEVFVDFHQVRELGVDLGG